MSNYMKTWRHRQNRKYITYRHAAREGSSHGHSQQAQKIWRFAHEVHSISSRKWQNHPFRGHKQCGFGDMRADKHTDTLIIILRSFPREEEAM